MSSEIPSLSLVDGAASLIPGDEIEAFLASLSQPASLVIDGTAAAAAAVPHVIATLPNESLPNESLPIDPPPLEPPCDPLRRRHKQTMPFIPVDLSTLTASPALPPRPLPEKPTPASLPTAPRFGLASSRVRQSLSPPERQRLIARKISPCPRLKIDLGCRIPHPVRQGIFESFLELFLQIHAGGANQAVQLATRLEAKVLSDAADAASYKALAVAKSRKLLQYPHHRPAEHAAV